jgi:peptide/nickel transport system substrate-binding protein
MHKTTHSSICWIVVLWLFVAGCSVKPVTSGVPVQVIDTPLDPTLQLLLTPSPMPPRLLTICMGQEPSSLFLYNDSSLAARVVRQAIYDGPFDVVNFDPLPVILEKKPTLANGDLAVVQVTVQPGSFIVSNDGKSVSLGEGVVYRPTGCSEATCAQIYTGQDPIQMDQLVVRFRLRAELQWSDGAPLTADDSQYSFEVAKSLFPRARPDLVAHTFSYQALDNLVVEWRGIPGYRDADYAMNFFTPLPRHIWGSLTPQDLLAAEVSNRLPIGWGPYVIQEWTLGDHISLNRNPAYFRSAEGLPFFDKLVFRFVPDKEQALNALLAGECDYLDETTGLESQSARLLDLQKNGQVAVAFQTGTAWEHVDFGILPSTPSGSLEPLFQLKETRQAMAMCIDRQRMADELFFGQSVVPDSYVSPMHPLFNLQVKKYPFDPKAAAALLDSIGWLDSDGNPGTPRIAQGVSGVADGTPFEFTFLTTTEEEKQRTAQILVTSLAQCGIKVQVSSLPWEELFTPGPDGPIFGRKFAMAQFSWMSALQPPCYLYTSQEIPGPYPEFSKGWGGANASGYSNPNFDYTCQQALSTLPEMPEHQAAHFQAQAIYAEDLPAIPLYLRLKLVVMRPDMCGVLMDPSADSSLWNLEIFNYGDGCTK